MKKQSTNTVPQSVGESLIPHNVEVATTDDLGVKDPATGRFHNLERDQLREVAAVYNAWRVGNLQDCTIRTPGDIQL